MSIAELKEMKCGNCQKNGLRVRSKVKNELHIDEDGYVVEKVLWIVLCEYCSHINKIVYAENR